MKLVFATISLLLTEECFAKSARLRNTNMAYKGSSGRKLQPGEENIFDKTAVPEPVLISIDPTEVPVETIDVTLSMSMLVVPEPVLISETPVDPIPELIAVDPTDAPIETIDVTISLSMPETEEVEVLPATLPATTAAPETTAAPVDVEMSMPEPVLPTIVGTTTAAAAISTEAVDEEVDVLPATLPATTAAPETTSAALDVVLSMSMPEEVVLYSDDDMASMSMPTSVEDTTETYGEYKPPVEER